MFPYIIISSWVKETLGYMDPESKPILGADITHYRFFLLLALNNVGYIVLKLWQ